MNFEVSSTLIPFSIHIDSLEEAEKLYYYLSFATIPQVETLNFFLHKVIEEYKKEKRVSK
jgi:hypothetical protein